MTERTGAAVDIDLVVGEVEVAHGRHGDHCEGFVDLEQVDIWCRPTNPVEQLASTATISSSKCPAAPAASARSSDAMA